MPARDQLRDALAAWAQQRPGVHYALVSREGLPQASKLPSAVHEETFAIMSATMLGAASTVNNELRGEDPQFITVKSTEFETFLSGVTKEYLVVLIIPHGTKREEAVDFLLSLHKVH